MIIKTKQWQVGPEERHLETANIRGKNHFEWLNPKEYGLGAKLFDYPDLFREVADSLRGASLHSKALIFYNPLQRVDDYLDFSYFADMAVCQKALGLHEEAADSYRKLAESGGSTDKRHQIMLNCKELDTLDTGGPKVINAGPSSISSGYGWLNKVEGLKRTTDISISDPSPFTMIAPRLPRLAPRTMVSGRIMDEKLRDKSSSVLSARMQTFIKKARNGDVESRIQWAKAAKTLIQDFQSEKTFFLNDKQPRFDSYSKEPRKKPSTLNVEQRLEDTNFGKRPLGCPTGRCLLKSALTQKRFRINSGL